MEIIFQLLRWLRRCWWRFRRFWRRIYYGFTNALMILGGAVLLSAVWYVVWFL